ncbi:MAG TPA: serine hydroxymethyltransferase, partial [Candidatus Egerieousia sp.]|nr:serine hydroxymethyltransferase [Candidatus Egerieousia sp.]
TSGLRVGTPAVTTRGLKENDIKEIVRLIDKVLNDITNPQVLEEVKHDVSQMMAGRPLYSW